MICDASQGRRECESASWQAPRSCGETQRSDLFCDPTDGPRGPSDPERAKMASPNKSVQY